ncbi:MAG: sulfurtransferase TusA [Gammaproteobacteria bacterium]|jgi:tRNA 2-thiouridine synthesizing protein A
MTSQSDKQLVADTVDATGLKCPEPVMMLRNALRQVADGTCLKLIATDPSTLRDIPTMCRFMRHVLVSQDELDGHYEFVVSARALNSQD